MEERLEIVYEDKYIIVIDKPSGLLSVGAPGRNRISAHERVSEYLFKKYKHNSRAYIVHRLDEYTSGLLMFAKEEQLKFYMRDYWNDIVKERRYVAVLHGVPQEKEGRLESYLVEDDKNFRVYSSSKDNGGLFSITNFKVLKADKERSLVEFNLETGRKNQIRVHASQLLRCPVLGDRKYGDERANKGIKRLCLHHKGFAFVHPVTGKIIRLSSNTPRYFKSLI